MPGPGRRLSAPSRTRAGWCFARRDARSRCSTRRAACSPATTVAPHEGYPLREGNLDDRCILTCNWHNWKFDLQSGRNLYGGEGLRTYPVEIRGGEVWIDLADPPLRRAPRRDPRQPARSRGGQRLRSHGARDRAPAPARRRSPRCATRRRRLVLGAHGVRLDPCLRRARGLAHALRRARGRRRDAPRVRAGRRRAYRRRRAARAAPSLPCRRPGLGGRGFRRRDRARGRRRRGGDAAGRSRSGARIRRFRAGPEPRRPRPLQRLRPPR